MYLVAKCWFSFANWTVVSRCQWRFPQTEHKTLHDHKELKRCLNVERSCTRRSRVCRRLICVTRSALWLWGRRRRCGWCSCWCRRHQWDCPRHFCHCRSDVFFSTLCLYATQSITFDAINLHTANISRNLHNSVSQFTVLHFPVPQISVRLDPSFSVSGAEFSAPPMIVMTMMTTTTTMVMMMMMIVQAARFCKCLRWPATSRSNASGNVMQINADDMQNRGQWKICCCILAV